jgi:hypothetical protein
MRKTVTWAAVAGTAAAWRQLRCSMDCQLSIGTMHQGQASAYLALQGHRFKPLRCGRHFGKPTSPKSIAF